MLEGKTESELASKRIAIRTNVAEDCEFLMFAQNATDLGEGGVCWCHAQFVSQGCSEWPPPGQSSLAAIARQRETSRLVVARRFQFAHDFDDTGATFNRVVEMKDEVGRIL